MIPHIVSRREPKRCAAAAVVAQPGRPSAISDTTSFENAEKVVKPPRMPVIAKSLSSGGRSCRCAKKAAATPIRYPPIRFAANVPSGTMWKSGLRASARSHRRQAPRPPPTNTQPAASALTASIRLDVRFPDDLGPAVDFALQERGELLGRAGGHVDAELGKALLHLRGGENLHHLGVQAVHDLARRPGDGEHAEPDAHVVARHAGLVDGRNLGRVLAARLGRYRD